MRLSDSAPKRRDRGNAVPAKRDTVTITQNLVLSRRKHPSGSGTRRASGVTSIAFERSSDAKLEYCAFGFRSLKGARARQDFVRRQLSVNDGDRAFGPEP